MEEGAPEIRPGGGAEGRAGGSGDASPAAAPGSARSRAAGEAVVARTLRLLAEHGGDADAPLRFAGVPGTAADLLAGGLDRLSLREIQAISARANVLTSNLDADRVGRAHFRGGDYRLLFYCLVGDHSLRQAIERAEEVFAAVDGRLGKLELVVAGDTARLELGRRPGPDDALGLAVALHGASNYHNILEWLIGSPLPTVAEFDFGEEAGGDIDRPLLPFTLRLGQPAMALSFATRFLDYPVIRSSDDLERLPDRNFLFEAPSRNTSLDVAERARRSLTRVLREEGSLCSLERLAGMLQLSEVMLRRRLARAGTSFRSLRDAARRQLAIELLGRTTLPIEAISDRLDFCDSDAFRRAMHAWTGLSPSAYRHQAFPQDMPPRRTAPRASGRSGSAATARRPAAGGGRG